MVLGEISNTFSLKVGGRQRYPFSSFLFNVILSLWPVSKGKKPKIKINIRYKQERKR